MTEQHLNPLNAAPATPSKPLAEVFANIPLRDQYDKPFDPKLLEKGPVIVLTAYGSCPRCTLVTKSVAAIQQKLEKDGQHVPIVVISVKPEDDRTLGGEQIITDYYAKGVKQFSGEHSNLADDKAKNVDDARNAAFNAGKSFSQQNRLLHYVIPSDAAIANIIQDSLGHKRGDKEAHAPTITLFNNGKYVEHYKGLQDGVDPNKPGGKEQEKEADAYAANLAPIVAGDIKNLALPAPQITQPTPASPSDTLTNKGLWNFGIPAIAGIVTLIMSGGGTLKSLLFGVLAAGGASVVTQWVTGTGFFAVKPDATPKTHGQDKTPEKQHGEEKVRQSCLPCPDLERAKAQFIEGKPVTEVCVADKDSPVVPNKIPLPLDKSTGVTYGA